MKPVRFDHEAEIEFYDSIVFYEERVAGLGARFDQAVQAEVSQLQLNPTRFRLISGTDEIRKLVMKSFPFVIYFMEMEQEIWIVAVAHCSREPGYWRDRS